MVDIAVPRFLSQEWIDELNAAAAHDPSVAELAAGADVTVQQTVTGGPGGDVTYAVRVADDRVEIVPGPCPAADATITEDHTTATAISRGELTPQAAFLAGRIRVSGNMTALVAHQDALQRLEVVFDGVRSRTTF